MDFFKSLVNDKTVRVKKLRAVDAAYIAGIVDGEGSIGVRRSLPSGKRMQSVHHNLVVTITNTDLDVLLWIRDRLGNVGTIQTRYPGHAGKPAHTKICYQYVVMARIACDFLVQLSPYLRIKKAKAQAGIMLAQSIRTLKERGKPRRLTSEEVQERDRLAYLVTNASQLLN